MHHVYTLNGMVGRYLRRRVERLAYWSQRPLQWFEIVSAMLVFGEVFNIYHHYCQSAGSYVHPVAATGTILALIAHLPES